MKRFFSLILALALVSSLLVSGLSVPAYAEGIYNVVCGTYYSAIYDKDFSGKGDISAVAMGTDGNGNVYTMQSGLSISFSGSRCYISGTPMEAGDKYFEFTVSFTSGETDIQYVRIISSRGSRDASKTVSCKTAEAFTSNIYDGIGTLSSFSASWNGIKLETSGTSLVLSGKPEASGTYTFSGNIVDSDVVDVKFNVAVTVGSVGVTVTKSPTNETCDEGDSALFISAAENYAKSEWRIVTADGSNCWRDEAEIEAKFPGVVVDIYTGKDNREYMSLDKIPYSMNGYYVQTKFTAADGKTYELTENHSALLTVVKTDLEQAKITSNPSNASLQPGQTTKLTVAASSPDGNTLKYQWYRNSDASTAGGSAIQGATSTTYTPPQETGTVYYYCAVINTNGQSSASPAYSTIASVTYAGEIAQTSEATTTPQTPQPAETDNAAAEQPASDTESSSKTSSKKEKDKDDSNGSFIIALGIIVAIAICCGTVIYLNLRKRAEQEDDPAQKKRYW